MANTYKQVLAWGLCVLAWACTEAPRPEVPPGSLSQQKTKPTAQSAEELVLAVGDSIVRYAEGSFLQLAESQPEAQALFVAQPDKLPAVQVLLQRYQGQLERRPLGKKEEKQWKRPSSLFSKKPPMKASVKERNDTFVYQRPILVQRRNCASCEEPSLINFMANDLAQLRVFSTQGLPQGYEVGTITGMWVIHIPKQALAAYR